YFLFLIEFQNYFLLFVPTKSRQKTRLGGPQGVGPNKTHSRRMFLQLALLKQVKTFFRLEAFYRQG
ncbi:hypothetical protein, partial [Candidatus Avelusimicrobium alvi]|uniref:hypothetical protein n=1 Tax=Candidatus Avelusimicrobium alvi TaxID=3416221 RepID=UPI003D0C97A2